MPETILWWLFGLACAFAFFFSYGMVGDLIRQWFGTRGICEAKKSSLPSLATVRPPQVRSSPVKIAPCGYDSPRLHREDTLFRIERLEAEIQEHKRNIDEILKSMKPSAPKEDPGKRQ